MTAHHGAWLIEAMEELAGKRAILIPHTNTAVRPWTYVISIIPRFSDSSKQSLDVVVSGARTHAAHTCGARSPTGRGSGESITAESALNLPSLWRPIMAISADQTAAH